MYCIYVSITYLLIKTNMPDAISKDDWSCVIIQKGFVLVYFINLKIFNMIIIYNVENINIDIIYV